MSTPRQHPRRRHTDGPRLLPLQGGRQEDFPSEAPAGQLEPGNLAAAVQGSTDGGPVTEAERAAAREWLLSIGQGAKPADAAAAVAAAIEWDQATAAEPYQLDVTREMDDTVRMGNSLSKAVRLELLADSMREQLRDGAIRRDPVDGAELDPVDGLPLPAEDEPELAPQLEQWQTLADLQASAAPLTFAAPPIQRETVEQALENDRCGVCLSADHFTEDHPEPEVHGTRGQAERSDGIPVRVMAWASRHDERSLDYGVRARLRAPAPLVDRAWAHGPILDQGTTPPLSLHDASGCTGHAVVNAANVHELSVRPTTEPEELYGEDDAMRVYERAQELDAWPGEEYPGTSILAAMKAGQELGLWGSYLWAFGTKDVAQALLQVGPVVVGIPWLSEMAQPGPDGIVTVAGQPLGGHAICLHAIRMTVAGRAGPWFGGLQTWGEEVGDRGVVWFHHRDMGQLLRSRGEAAIPLAEGQTP